MHVFRWSISTARALAFAELGEAFNKFFKSSRSPSLAGPSLRVIQYRYLIHYHRSVMHQWYPFFLLRAGKEVIEVLLQDPVLNI